jgi:hypothetical protein
LPARSFLAGNGAKRAGMSAGAAGRVPALQPPVDHGLWCAGDFVIGG